jgi:hypothetical protein
MATFDFSQGNPEFELQKQQLNRQQKMAEALLAQGQQMAQGPAGQMVSGRYVANSPLQMLNAPVNQLVGAYLSSKGDEKAAKLAEALRGKESELLNQYLGALTPTAAVEGGVYGPDNKLTTQTTADMYGPNMELNPAYKQVEATSAKGPDYKSAFAAAMNPYAPSWLKAQAIEMLKPQKRAEGEVIERIDLTTGQMIPISQGGGKVGQDIKDAAREAKLDINKIDSWSPQDWANVRAVEARANLSKRPVNAISIPNFAEKTFAGGLAEDQVKKFATLQTNAEKAPDILANVAESKKILKSGKFFSGSPANVQLEMAKFADAFGLGGKETKDKAANTQTLITNAAGSTLDSIAGSGLGAGQGFTDKDLKFLQEAKSFRIDMTDTNIARILDLQERAAKASVGRYNQRLGSLPQASIQAMGLTPIVLPRTADEIVGGK